MQSKIVRAVGSALAAFGTAALAVPSEPASSLPTGGRWASNPDGTAGGTISTPSATQMQLNQNQHSGVIDFSCFCSRQGTHVNLTAPSADSTTLIRSVEGANLWGRFTANDRVFISSSPGVYFAPSASVEVGSLFATSLSITDADFRAGRYQFSNDGAAGPVINRGTIITPRGYAALAAPQVRNEGLIVARLGSVALAAGDRVMLDIVGDGLVNVSVERDALDALALNSGTIEADGGRVLLTARSANALLDTVINNSGVIRANSLVERNGEIVLDGGERGSVSVSGTLESQGGSVTIRGGSTMNISGDQTITAGAGSIAVVGSGTSVVNITGTGTLATTGGSINIGTGTSGTVNLTGSGTLAVGGGSLTLSGGTIRSNGSVVLSGTSGMTPEELEEGKKVSAGVGGLMLNEIARTAVAETQPTSALRQTIELGTRTEFGILAPMDHQIVGTGIRIPGS
jgi:filamentous hemagglutinin family protein